MSYIFRGRLCGYICPDCREPLSKVKVRLYRAGDEREVVARAVAQPKDTFAILNEEQVDERKSRLIAEAETDDGGGFAFELDGDGRYDGGPVEVDVYCETVPRAKPQRRGSEPVQFTITTLQPQWRETDRALVAYWEYCLPARYWCLVRGRFRAWTICGKVVLCNQRIPTPVPNVRVLAFDADIVQEDALGDDITDSQGHFRIDYTAADFKRTPISWISWEWVSGPDLYFRVETLGGGTLLNETSARARQPDRENVGHCFCVDLCVDEAPPETIQAIFTHVGHFDIQWDIDATSGLTSSAQPAGMPNAHGGPGFGFHDGRYGDGIKLIGDCPAHHQNGGGQLMRYRFLYQDLTHSGALTPVTENMLTAIDVGVRFVPWNTHGTGVVLTPQTIWVGPIGSPTLPLPPPDPGLPPGTPWGPVPPVRLKPDADGWVPVDPTTNIHAYSGPLLQFRTASVVPGGTPPNNGAGNDVSPANQRNGTKLKIVFEAEPVGGAVPGAPTISQTLDAILINNWAEVILLDLQQFHESAVNCCAPINAELDIRYTTDHEFLSSWHLGLSSCAIGPSWTPPALPSGPGPRGDADTHHEPTTLWPACSYILSLSTTKKVTDGEHDSDGGYVQLSFCIEH